MLKPNKAPAMVPLTIQLTLIGTVENSKFRPDFNTFSTFIVVTIIKHFKNCVFCKQSIFLFHKNKNAITIYTNVHRNIF